MAAETRSIRGRPSERRGTGTMEDLDWLVAKAHGDLQNSTPILSAMQESASIRELKPRNPNLNSLLTSAVTNGTTIARLHGINLAAGEIASND